MSRGVRRHERISLRDPFESVFVGGAFQPREPRLKTAKRYKKIPEKPAVEKFRAAPARIRRGSRAWRSRRGASRRLGFVRGASARRRWFTPTTMREEQHRCSTHYLVVRGSGVVEVGRGGRAHCRPGMARCQVWMSAILCAYAGFKNQTGLSPSCPAVGGACQPRKLNWKNTARRKPRKRVSENRTRKVFARWRRAWCAHP